jgi:NADH:quinone reductase (non-electrogenic)
LEERHAGIDEFAPLLSGLRQSSIWENGDCDAGLLPVGQSIGLIHDVISCEALIKRMVGECESIFNKLR